MSTAAEHPILVELSVVLVARGNDPAILNPDFLRYNEIVDDGMHILESPISTPAFSRIVYENGISVTAVPERFVFQQNAEELLEKDCIVPEIAKRFLDTVRNVTYLAVGINPKGILPLHAGISEDISDKLVGGGDWLSFRDVQPQIDLKAVYQYEARQITMDVGQVTRRNTNGSPSHGLFFQVNVHRDIGAGSQTQRIERITSILSSWNDDMLDFNALIRKFNSGVPSP